MESSVLASINKVSVNNIAWTVKNKTSASVIEVMDSSMGLSENLNSLLALINMIQEKMSNPAVRAASKP